MSSAYSRRLSFGRVYSLAGLACLVVTGCFSGEYGRRMDQTVGKLNAHGEKAAAVFGTVTPVVDAAGAATGISLRMPVFVDGKAKSLGVGSDNAQPPFFALPGFAYAYEIPFEGDPAYLYIAAVKVDEKPADSLAQEVQSGVGKTFSGAVWQDVTLETFTGGSIAVKRLSVAGPQRFGTEKTDGQFDLYLISSPTYNVLIGWRASAATAAAQGFFHKVSISMGTVEGAN